MDQKNQRIELPAWYGEFGWEVMSWAPICRKLALDYEQVIVSSFEGMGPLYADFATEFRPHDKTDRGLDYHRHPFHSPRPGSRRYADEVLS